MISFVAFAAGLCRKEVYFAIGNSDAALQVVRGPESGEALETLVVLLVYTVVDCLVAFEAIDRLDERLITSNTKLIGVGLAVWNVFEALRGIREVISVIALGAFLCCEVEGLAVEVG
jgi:hypothetical protein